MLKRQWPVGVIQICWIAPGPVDVGQRERLARLDADGGRDLPALAEVARAALRRCPRWPCRALPFSPVKFSGLIERVFAFDSRERLPMFMPRPLVPWLCGCADRLTPTSAAAATHTTTATDVLKACFMTATPPPHARARRASMTGRRIAWRRRPCGAVGDRRSAEPGESPEPVRPPDPAEHGRDRPGQDPRRADGHGYKADRPTSRCRPACP